MVMVNYSCRKS